MIPTEQDKQSWEPMSVTDLGHVTELVMGANEEPPAVGKLTMVPQEDMGVEPKKPTGQG